MATLPLQCRSSLADQVSSQSPLQRGGPVITHDLDMAGAVGEQVAVMQHGRLVECGRTAEVFHSPKHPYTKMLLHATAEVGRLEVAG